MSKAGFVTLVLQNTGDQLADIGFIINNQNISSHKFYSFTQKQLVKVREAVRIPG